MEKRERMIILVLVCIIAVSGIILTRNLGKSEKEISEENALTQLDRAYNKINPTTAKLVSSSVEYTDNQDDVNELPELKDNSITCKHTTNTYIEIFSSPEKAEKSTDGWLREMAEQFNKENKTIDGKKVSVQIRDVTSGLAYDYIRTGKYVPDGFTPSNMMWVNMLNAKGVETDIISKRMVGNTAIIVMKNDIYDQFVKDHGSVNLKAVVEATEKGEFVMGYTNPFTSSTGLNFLVSTLQRYDSKNIFSDTATQKFSAFQSNIPFVSVNTVQMRNAAENGTLDGFILESQLYENDSSLKKNYKAVPFGYRHDNPLVSVGHLSSIKKSIIKEFSKYCQSDKAQALASQYGFNTNNKYSYESDELDGQTLLQVQKLYKTSKDVSPVIGVFVADVSGSMEGTPIKSLKKSLINSIQYISSTNSIGLVSYEDDVTINVPIGKFDMKQKAYFKGGVESLSAGGGTATYDAVIVGMKMLEEELKNQPDAKPILFVLSDGETNRGYDFDEIENIVSGLKIPICTINYNDGDADSLKALSNINESAYINASSEDVVYQLKNLLNAQM